MACYVLTMNNCGKVREGCNESADRIFPHFQSIKEIRVALNKNKMLPVCIGKVGDLKLLMW